MNARYAARLEALRDDAEALAAELAEQRDAAEPIDKPGWRYPARYVDKACEQLRKACEYGR